MNEEFIVNDTEKLHIALSRIRTVRKQSVALDCTDEGGVTVVGLRTGALVGTTTGAFVGYAIGNFVGLETGVFVGFVSELFVETGLDVGTVLFPEITTLPDDGCLDGCMCGELVDPTVTLVPSVC